MGKKIITLEFEAVTLTVEANDSLRKRSFSLCPVVTMEGKKIYMDQSHRKFKLEELVSVEITDESSVTFSSTTNIVFCRSFVVAQGKSKAEEAKMFRTFCNRLQSYLPGHRKEDAHKKAHGGAVSSRYFANKLSKPSSGSRGKTFGSRPLSKRHIPLANNSWSDDEEDKHKPKSLEMVKDLVVDVTLEEAKTVPVVDKASPTDDEIHNDTDNDEEPIFGLQSNAKTVTSRKPKRRVLDDDDESDLEASMTTPTTATQRAVTPSHTTSTPGDVKPEEESSLSMDVDGEEEEEGWKPASRPTDKNQPKIRSFFSAASVKKKPPRSFDPAKNADLTAPSSPVPPQTKVIMPSASGRKKSLSSNNGEWLNLSQAAATSPKKLQSTLLFGPNSNTFRKTTTSSAIEQEDPIHDWDDKEETSGTTPPRNTVNPLDKLDTGRKLPFLEGAESSRKRQRVQQLHGTSSRLSILSPVTARSVLFTNPSSTLASEPPVIVRRHRGLRNLGNTCYMNASVQMLAAWCCQRLPHSDKRNPLTTNLWNISSQLLEEIPKIVPSHSSMVLDPTELKKAMDAKTTKFVGYEQRDAHEFLSDMIDLVHDELQAHKQADSSTSEDQGCVTDDFRLTVQVNLQCMSCSYTRTKEEMYRHLSIDLPLATGDNDETQAQLPNSLDQFFQPEVRELRCEKCLEGTHAQQTIKILSRPKMLLLHLKRFVVVEKPSEVVGGNENAQPNSPSARNVVMDYVLQKNKKRVEILPKLTLAPYQLKPTDTEPNQQEYGLESVVYHIGRTASSGHYMADALRPMLWDTNDETNKKKDDQDKAKNTTGQEATDIVPKTKSDDEDYNYEGRQWTSFDDRNSGRIKISAIKSDPMKQKTAYMLLYRLKV